MGFAPSVTCWEAIREHPFSTSKFTAASKSGLNQWVMDQVVNTYRLCAGIMIRMWAIRLETHGFAAGKAMPLAVNRQFKLATDDNDILRDISFSAIVAGFVAVLVGYTSSAAIIFQAAAAAGASPIQIGGWLSMLGLGMGITSLGLSLYYRTPILTAWSTPGAALLVTSLPGTPLNEAIGVFIFATCCVVSLACLPG